MKTGKIDVTKIEKEYLFKGEKGTYLDLLIVENNGGRDAYGNDGYIAQGISKEARLAGKRGPIIGNWRDISTQQPKTEEPKKQSRPTTDNEPDEIPF